MNDERKAPSPFGPGAPVRARAIAARLLACVLALLCAFAGARSQSAARKTPGADGAALVKAVETYAERRRAELRAQGIPVDRAAAERIAREQRELAAAGAARLAARKDPAPRDLFHLGLLYNHGARPADALAALRRFLAVPDLSAYAEQSQVARLLVAALSAQSGDAEAAERARADFLSAEPRAPFRLYQLEQEMALGYARAKLYERAASRAREALRLARALTPQELPPGAAREQFIYDAGATLADLHDASNRPEESLAALVSLQRLALELPSASLYKLVSANYARRQVEIERALEEAPPSAPATAPELSAAVWIGGSPAKLADLRGRVVLLDFWYDWCTWCKVAFPTLGRWQEKYGDAGLVVVGVTDLGATQGGGQTREGKLEHLRQLHREQRLPYAFAVAERPADNLASYGVSMFPSSVLIDRRGAVRLISVGGSPREIQRIAQMIERLVAEPPPAAAPTAGR